MYAWYGHACIHILGYIVLFSLVWIHAALVVGSRLDFLGGRGVDLPVRVYYLGTFNMTARCLLRPPPKFDGVDAACVHVSCFIWMSFSLSGSPFIGGWTDYGKSGIICSTDG